MRTMISLPRWRAQHTPGTVLSAAVHKPVVITSVLETELSSSPLTEATPAPRPGLPSCALSSHALCGAEEWLRLGRPPTDAPGSSVCAAWERAGNSIHFYYVWFSLALLPVTSHVGPVTAPLTFQGLPSPRTICLQPCRTSPLLSPSLQHPSAPTTLPQP